MKLPSSLTTVTIFSKFLALFLFILFPLVGFKLGIEYQRLLSETQNNSSVLGLSGVCISIDPLIILGTVVMQLVIVITLVISAVIYFIKKKKGIISRRYVVSVITIIGIEAIIWSVLSLTHVYLVKQHATCSGASDIDVLPPIDITRYSNPSPSIAISNWKTYRNEAYGFEFMYPFELELTEVKGQGDNDYSFQVALAKNTNPKYVTLNVEKDNNLDLWVDYRKSRIIGHVADKIDNETEITVNSRVGKRLDYVIYTRDKQVNYSDIIFTDERYTYYLISPSELTNQILSTFRFSGKK